MDRIFDIVPVAVSDEFGRDEQQLQPRDTDRMGHDAFEYPFSRLNGCIGYTFSGHHLHIAPDVVGQHHDLEEGIIALELGRREHVHPFPLGFSHQVLYIGPLIIFFDDPMGRSGQSGTKDPVGILVILEQRALLGLTRSGLLCFGDPHGYKTTRHVPTHGLIETTVKFHRLAFPGAIPPGIKDRGTPSIGDNKIKPGVQGGLDAIPAQKLPFGPDQDFLNTSMQLILNSGDQRSTSFPVHRGPLQQFAQKILPGFFDKGQQGPETFFAPVCRIIPLPDPLLIPVNRLDRRIDIDPDAMPPKSAQLPHPFPQDTHHLEQRLALVDSQTVPVPPKGAGRQQSGKPEKTAQQSIQPYINKMPDQVKPGKQKHQNLHHHPIVPQLGFTQSLKIHQIQKLDQRQQSAKRAQLLGAGLIYHKSVDFSGSFAICKRSFTKIAFPANNFSSFYYLGTSCYSSLGSAKSFS